MMIKGWRVSVQKSPSTSVSILAFQVSFVLQLVTPYFWSKNHNWDEEIIGSTEYALGMEDPWPICFFLIFNGISRLSTSGPITRHALLLAFDWWSTISYGIVIVIHSGSLRFWVFLGLIVILTQIKRKKNNKTNYNTNNSKTNIIIPSLRGPSSSGKTVSLYFCW